MIEGDKLMFPIYVNQAGYLPEKRKICIATEEHSEFTVKDMQGKTCFKGSFFSFGFDELSGDRVYHGDFSELTMPGKYRIHAGDQVSATFDIGEQVYDKLLYDVMRAFYFLRCGCELEEKHAGCYTHKACHTSDATVWDNRAIKKSIVGGWHDAGDYGRYVGPGAVALSHLLYAFMLYPNALKGLQLNIPESGNGQPDVLNECRWELDWILKMQREDGAVYHKLTTANFCGFIMPEEDTAEQFLLPVSSIAAADFAAICALASRVYREYDAEYADTFLQAAKKTYQWLNENPNFLGFRNPEGCGTGGYGERDDHSNRFWAAAEMYAATGEARYLEDVKMQLAQHDIFLTALGWGEVGGMGSMALLTTDYSVDESIKERVKKAVIDQAADLKQNADNNGYFCTMKEHEYNWGSNMGLMHHGMILMMADMLNGSSEYIEYALAQLHVLMGVNALGISYVTGNGDYACNHPHLRPACADGIDACMPGMVCGGPNRHLNDRDHSKELLQAGTPPMKCFVDDWRCYSLNEITIYWNSPVVFLLAAVLNGKMPAAKGQALG